MLKSRPVRTEPKRPERFVCRDCYVTWVCRHNYAPDKKPPVLNMLPDGTRGTCPACGSGDLRPFEDVGSNYSK